MNINRTLLKRILLPVLALIFLSLISPSNLTFAADCTADTKAVTTADTSISTEALSHLVKPLTKCELEPEARAWLLLLKAKITEISNSQIAALYKDEEIDAAEEAEDAIEDVKEAKLESNQEEKAETAKEAKQAIKEKDAAEKKLTQNKALQEIIEDAKITAKEDGASIDTNDKSIDAKTDLKTALLEHMNVLISERTVLIDQLNTVLAEWVAKGGDATDYDNYITAVSGIKVDVTDASATWTTVTGWLLSPEGGLRWALNLIKFVVIISVFYLLSVVAGKAAKKAFSNSKQLSILLREFLVLSIQRGILMIGLFVGLSALEVNIGPVLAIIGAAGFVIAFALQNSLSNFASGILMLIYRPFDLGDMISVAGTQGQVDSMNLLSTQLRTPDNQLVIVPNNSVWGDVIVNITGISRRRIDLVFGIGYEDDIDKAQKILQDIIADHELILKLPEPIVRLHELADSSVNFVCRPWVRPDDYWEAYWYVTREVKRRFDAEGISIPFPQRDVHIYQQTPGNNESKT